jgi:indole-3-glycerol phosphate synthase
MKNILEEIVARKVIEVAEQKSRVSIDTLVKNPLFERKCLSLKERLLGSDTGIISEFKRKSPSKGWIHADADAAVIPAGYCNAGASGISILTDFHYFGGTTDDVLTARPLVSCPILRKEFVIDEYQIYEAKALGADVILLIAAALDVNHCQSLAQTARQLGLEVLLEIHDENELHYASEFVTLLGVNNRNLKTFVTDVQSSFDLALKIPHDFVKVSESGISQPQSVIDLRSAGYRGFLMGENFMKESNPPLALENFCKQLHL